MPDRPHVILVLSDQHRGQATGHAGDVNLKTPVLDRLAAEGMSFQRAYANCPVCTPSRGTLFSGRHAHAGPVQGFWDVYKPAAPSLATLLGEAGYRTHYIGKWHCGVILDQTPTSFDRPPRNPRLGLGYRTPEAFRGGFRGWQANEFVGFHDGNFYYEDDAIDPTWLSGYATDDFTDLAVSMIREYDDDAPLFMTLSVVPPHFPLEVPERWRRHDPDALVLRPNCARDRRTRERLAVYYDMIENLDWNLGRLRSAIEGSDRFRHDTLFLYLSDHGEFMGSHDRCCRKELPHEESVRIPAVFHQPGRIRGGVDRETLFSLVDVTPTVLGLLDLPRPPYLQGRNAAPLLLGEAAEEPPEMVLLEMVGSPRWNLDMPDWRGLVTRRWKYAFFEDGREMLHDLNEDPYEQRNCATDETTIRARMRRRLLDELARTREPFFDVLMEHGVRPPAGRDVTAQTGDSPRSAPRKSATAEGAERPAASKAFTLVELLVVIAIISVLAAMLLPALEGALTMAKRTKCLNALRQTGIGVESYVSENDGLYPVREAIEQDLDAYAYSLY